MKLINGVEVRYSFPNMKRVAIVERMGLGESFKETWAKMTKDEKEYDRVAGVWGKYIETVTENAPAELMDIEKLTAGEVLDIVSGFTMSAIEIRNSQSGS